MFIITFFYLLEDICVVCHLLQDIGVICDLLEDICVGFPLYFWILWSILFTLQKRCYMKKKVIAFVFQWEPYGTSQDFCYNQIMQ